MPTDIAESISPDRKRTTLSDPYSRDTTPEAQRYLNNLVREMPQAKRAARFFSLNQFVRRNAIGGRQLRDATLSEREAQLLVIRSMLGDELYHRVYESRR